MQASDIQHIITGLVNGIGKNNLINLSPGKVITAFLKEAQGNSCILVCEGKEITARLDTQLPPGQNLKLLVEGEKNGHIVLKLLSNNTDENEIPLRSITGRLGLPENSLNLKLIGEMIKQQMPLTPVSSAKLSGFIKSIDIPEQEIWIPVFMENNRIQLTQQNFNGVTGLLTDLQFINKDLAKLTVVLQSLLTAENGSGLAETAQKIINILSGLEISPDQGSETLAAKLELAVRLLTGVKTSEQEGVGSLGPMLEKLALNIKQDNTGEHKEIIRLIQNVSEKLETVRNFNLQSDVGRENLMVFYSTVRFENRNEPLRLMLKYREGKEKNRNLSSCRLEIKLNTPGLGTVKSEVQVLNKNLTVQFVTTTEPAGKALDLFAGILAERLSQMDYVMNYLPARVETESDNNFLTDSGTRVHGLFQLNLTI